MLSANKEKLISFLSGSSQYVVPFFQRSYVWKIENWTELWENILEEYEELNKNNNSEHFVGTIIIKQILSKRVGATEYELIDGQQRLTTICILLRAFYDSTNEDTAKTWIKSFYSFIDSYGKENLRIKHSKVDGEHFISVIQNENNNNVVLWNEYKDLNTEELKNKIETKNNIFAAYIYFRHKIANDCNLENIRQYVNVITERLPVIHMALNADDDVQQIFDTINSLGVKLTTAELLKNHLYSNSAIINLYKEYWYNVFEIDEDAMDFWNQDKTSGRIRRTTVELFLYSYLVIIKENNVKIESLFKEFKTHLKNKTDAELTAFAKELYEYARIYQEMPDGENLSDIAYQEHEKRFFHIIREFEITTIFPLILYVYKKVKEDERVKILKVLESYITRRTVCKLTTQNYNNLFLSLLSEMKQMDKISAENIREKLLQFSDNTNKFPDDSEFESAFGTSHLTNKYSREILYNIALYQLDNEFSDNPRLNINGFSVEHIMPKNWNKNWKDFPEGITEDYRKHKLLTLGNLTLVKGKLNSSMRDSGWNKKRITLTKFSTLRQTTDYLHNSDWNEKTIEDRQEKLCKLALEIWTK